MKKEIRMTTAFTVTSSSGMSSCLTLTETLSSRSACYLLMEHANVASFKTSACAKVTAMLVWLPYCVLCETKTKRFFTLSCKDFFLFCLCTRWLLPGEDR